MGPQIGCDHRSRSPPFSRHRGCRLAGDGGYQSALLAPLATAIASSRIGNRLILH